MTSMEQHITVVKRPRITGISVTYGRKFNLGDFNSAHLEISLYAELDEDDSPEDARAQLWADAKASVKEQALPLLRKQQVRVEEAFAGLPTDVQEQINAHHRPD